MLTRCPSCQASVLDDDAEVCPFCGSPMDPAQAKGFQPAEKPAQKPAKASAAKPAASKSSSSPTKEKRPASKPSGNPAAPKTSPSGAKTRSGKTSDDPFAVDPSTMSGVIPLSTKRTPQRPQKIVCPMCDTVGYAPVAASGKDVRCANSKCMVPVFTAPDFAAPKREIIEAPSSKGTVLTILGVAAVVLGGGFVYWWFNFRVPEPSPTTPNIATPTPATSDVPVEPDPHGEEPAVVAASASPDEVRARAFEQWPRVTETVADILRRPVRLRHAAESHAIAGDLEQAQAYLDEIDAGDDRDRFYKIGPLAEIAWARLEAGDEAGAKAAVEELVGLRETIPNQGFEPARTAILWAAATARFGDADAAHEIAAARRDDPAGERLLAAMESAAALTDFGLHANHQWRPVLPWSAPKSVAVAMNLLRHDQSETAQRWGEEMTDARAKAETLAAWAEGQVAREADSAESVRQAVASLDPAIRLYVLSRAALRALARQDAATAEALFADIESVADEIAPTEPLTAATAGELFNIDLSGTAGEQLRAAAFAEAAHLAAGLEKNEPATAFLWRAVDHLRSAAPPAAEVAARNQEFESAGLDGARETLKTELGLSNAAAEEAATDYRRKLPGYVEAAEAALAGQAEILARGVGWGLGQPILAEIQARAAGGGPKYLATSAGGRLFAAFDQVDNSKGMQAARKAGVMDRDVPHKSGIELMVWPLVEQGKLPEAGQQFAATTWNKLPDSTRLSLGLRIVSRLASEGKPAAIAQFLRPISSDDAGEMYRAWGARAGATDNGMGFLDQIEQSRLSITALAAALRGLTAGLETLP